MGFFGWFGIAFVYAVLCSYLALRKRDLLRIPWINYVLVVGFLTLLFLMMRTLAGAEAGGYGSAFATAITVAGTIVLLAFCFSPYVLFLIVEITGRAHRSLTGIDGMKVAKTYDVAEKLEKERRHEEALRLYEEEAGKDASDAEARRRAGELCLKLDRPDDAVRWFREAIGRIEETENRVTLTFRMAEVIDQKLGNREEARRLLEEVAARHVGTPFERFAQERLGRMQPPSSTPPTSAAGP